MAKLPNHEELADLSKRPADEVIIDDVTLRNLLKVSARTTAYWRSKGIITYSKPDGKIFYKLSDVLDFLKQYEVPAVTVNLNIAL